tara:strand:- start:4747 stop:5943 length:1197 start_codon:yes stop_codon:yes gene_type:complete
MARGRGGFIGQDGLNAPDSPTGVSGTPDDQSVSVAFTAPTDVGGSAITGFRAQSNTGVGASGTSSPITVTGLSNGTSYTFNVWAINAFGYSAPSDASTGVSPVAPVSGRALFFGGSNGSSTNVIDYINMASAGNASDFGDLSAATQRSAATASSTRAINGGGQGATSAITYVTIASTGNSSSFGNLLEAAAGQSNYAFGAVSNGTRGIWGGGYPSGNTNVIQYVTIASAGDATDFGDLTAARSSTRGNVNSTTRGLIVGGYESGTVDKIDYITMASTGNATDFGDTLSGAERSGATASNATRGIMAGASSASNVIQYLTIASTGNMQDFGDLSVAQERPIGVSSSTKFFCAGGYGSGSYSNIIETVVFSSLSNATDFGDLTVARNMLASASNAHGGIS